MVRKATNYVNVTYSEVIDLQTTAGKTSIIGIHTPIGSRPVNRLYGLFNQYRKFRYNGCSVQMVPAAQLPVDPLGLTGMPGTTDLMDPRDLLNPIISHGCHGESLSAVLNNIYRTVTFVNGKPSSVVGDGDVSDSAVMVNTVNQSDALSQYYQCLTDTTWRKHGIQQGLRLGWLRPLVHKVARSEPIVPSSAQALSDPIPQDLADAGLYMPIDSSNQTTLVPQGMQGAYYQGTDTWSGYSYPQMLTSGLTRLGWLPTSRTLNQGGLVYEVPCTLPKLFMSCIVLPPAYNVEQFFRMVIRHSFSFSDFTTSLGLSSMDRDTQPLNFNNYFNWIDYSVSDSPESANSDLIDQGTTLDIIGGSSEVIVDGVQ